MKQGKEESAWGGQGRPLCPEDIWAETYRRQLSELSGYLKKRFQAEGTVSAEGLEWSGDKPGAFEGQRGGVGGKVGEGTEAKSEWASPLALM